MKKSTLNIILYSVMGILFISICVLLIKIANRPHYISSPEPVNEIKEISFNVYQSKPDKEESIDEATTQSEDYVEETFAEKNLQRGKTSTKVNIREQADAESRLLETVEEGYTFDIIEIMDSGWVKISYQGGEAYISSAYVILIN